MTDMRMALAVLCFVMGFTSQPERSTFAQDSVQQRSLPPDYRFYSQQGLFVYHVDGKTIVNVAPKTRWPFEFNPDSLQHLRQLGIVDRVVIACSKGIRPEHYRMLSQMEGIRHLRVLEHGEDAGAMMKHIAKIPHLSNLELSLSGLTPSDLHPLEDMPNLEELYIYTGSLSEDHVRVVADRSFGIKSLKLSTAGNYQPTIDDVRTLTFIPTLERLEVDGSRISKRERDNLARDFPGIEFSFSTRK